jgi:signal transduction histidine kinase
MPHHEVAAVLAECIDDLKLAIDSIEPVDQDLLLLLATLRFRIGARLENGGIILHWNVSDIPPLDWLNPSCSLHVLRILQEALSNIIKHSGATEVSLSTRITLTLSSCRSMTTAAALMPNRRSP